MRTTKNHTTEQTTIVGEEFVLKLPIELQFTPKWSVMVSKNTVANIYEFEEERFDRQTGLPTGQMQKVYKTTVVNKNGNMPRSIYMGGSGYHHVTNLFDLGQYIKEVSKALQPKKRVTKQVVEDEDDDN